ncbi:MAG: DUF1015 domain-containing protein [Desulfuromonadales bacterium]|nr:DUF1015 domain-containing protein [Desulfuromonadales bacterium]
MVFDTIALQVPNILLPRQGVDLQHWAVIACDQYTSDKDYWKKLKAFVADSPSTLNLIYPEVYLEETDSEVRIAAINSCMQDYLDQGVLEEQPPGFLLLDRKTSEVPSRKGLIVALDLEGYDYNKGASSLIRATEGTILDRLPPRIRVRNAAPIELPHIMVLIDDPEQTVIEPLFRCNLQPVYDFDLCCNGGRLRGWRVDGPLEIDAVAEALRQLADPDKFARRYDVHDRPVVLYAMGDGNHSFATAKAIWEELKQGAEDRIDIMNHPARYALVELINIHDPGLEFEAIHRVVFDCDPQQLLADMAHYYKGKGSALTLLRSADRTELAARQLSETEAGRQSILFVDNSGPGLLTIDQPEFHLAVATLQTFLDLYLEQNSKARIDYIHGDEPVTGLGRQIGNIGFYLPAISKHDLFKTIILDGALPRKTFSMGEADEKRFYLECRKIKA